MQYNMAATKGIDKGKPVEGVPAYRAAIFLCPNCEDRLIEDPKTKKYDDIECDLCGRRTQKVISCRPCDYDLCWRCAARRAEPKRPVQQAESW